MKCKSLLLCQDISGNTILHLAAENSRVELIPSLKGFVKPRTLNHKYNGAAHIAAENGDYETLKVNKNIKI